MRAVLAFLAVNLGFAAGAIVAASVFLGLGLLVKAVPFLGHEPFAWFTVSVVSLSSGIGFLWVLTVFIGRASR